MNYGLLINNRLILCPIHLQIQPLLNQKPFNVRLVRLKVLFNQRQLSLKRIEHNIKAFINYQALMDKLVLDTNVLIDGVKDENSAAWKIIDNAISGSIQLYISNPLQREYRRILQREINDPAYAERINFLLEIAVNVEVHNIQRLVPDDPEDDKVIATALAAKADFLISEDRHLLDLDFQTSVRIIKPGEYINRNVKDSSWGDFARLIGIN